jgi:hypothetical protein
MRHTGHQPNRGAGAPHSVAGSRFVERILTVAATLKQQDRNIVDYALHDDPAPSLLPDSAHSPRLEPARA